MLLAAATAAAAVGCRGRDKPPEAGERLLTEREAADIVWALPEVKAFAKRVERLSKGQVRAFAMVTRTPADCQAAGEPPAWEFYVGESHDTHAARWNTFQVDAATGQVRGYGVNGELITLDEWRNRLAIESGRALPDE